MSALFLMKSRLRRIWCTINIHSASLLSFVKIGDINDHLSKFEDSTSSDTPKPNLATHVFTFMVSGILSSLEFSYVSFPCSSVSGDQLYSVWGCVRRLEACGFKVVALTYDGASANHNFLSCTSLRTDSPTKQNPYANEDRPIFFIRPPSFDRKCAELLGKCTVIVAQEIF